MSKRILLLLILFMTVRCAAWAELRFGPYLQSLAPDTMAVCAFVAPGDRVVVTLTDPGKQFTATGDSPACATLTGLAPNVEHSYEMTVNGRVVTPKEPPSFLASSDVDLTLVVYGDTRSGDESFDLSHRQVVQAIRETAVPDAIFHTGDFVERGDDLDLWTNFFHIEKPLLAAAPIFPAIGRSDQPPDLMRKIFPLLKDSPWYSFDRGEAHVAVLNLWREQDQKDDETAAAGAQASWLREDLARARERGARDLFVLMHEPPVDVSGKPTAAARDVFMPLFSAFNVTAVFSGAHYFSHFVQGGVHYFTNGGGGALLEAQKPAEGVYRFYSAIHHFLVLECGRAGVRVRAVNTQGSDFYEVRFDQEKAGVHEDQAPTYTLSFDGGDHTVPMTVFHQHGCSDCESFKAEIPDLAHRTKATLVATFRNLDDAENLALLKTLSDQTAPTPIVALGPEVFAGLDEIHDRLDASIVAAASRQQKGTAQAGRIAVVVGVLLAGLVLVVSLLALRRKKQA